MKKIFITTTLLCIATTCSAQKISNQIPSYIQNWNKHQDILSKKEIYFHELSENVSYSQRSIYRVSPPESLKFNINRVDNLPKKNKNLHSCEYEPRNIASLCLFDTRSTERNIIKNTKGEFVHGGLSPDQKFIAYSSTEKPLIIQSLVNLDNIQTIEGIATERGGSIQFSNDNRYLLWSSYFYFKIDTPNFKLVDLENGKLIYEFNHGIYPQFSPDGEKILISLSTIPHYDKKEYSILDIKSLQEKIIGKLYHKGQAPPIVELPKRDKPHTWIERRKALAKPDFTCMNAVWLTNDNFLCEQATNVEFNECENCQVSHFFREDKVTESQLCIYDLETKEILPISPPLPIDRFYIFDKETSN